jgi:hypothetical protein
VIQVFYRGADNNLWTRWRHVDGTWSVEQGLAVGPQLIGNGYPYQPSGPIAGLMGGEPFACQIQGSNTVAVFFQGYGRYSWALYILQRRDDGVWFNQMQLVGLNDAPASPPEYASLIGKPFVVNTPILNPNSQTVFYRGAFGNNLVSTSQSPMGGYEILYWTTEMNWDGSLAGDPFAINLPGHVVQVFYRGTDNHLQTQWGPATCLVPCDMPTPDMFGSVAGKEQDLGGDLGGDPFAIIAS